MSVPSSTLRVAARGQALQVRLKPTGHQSWAPAWCRAAAPGATRSLHKGHADKTMEKLNQPRHKWLKEVDQAPDKSHIRRQKDTYLRELDLAHGSLSGLFKDDTTARDAFTPIPEEDQKKQAEGKMHKENVNEALRMYRLLKPDAPPFYEEDAMLSMQAKMNRILTDEKPADAVVPSSNKHTDPFQAYLPVVNQRAFLLALEVIVGSLADDIETLCIEVGVSKEDFPKVDDPLRFKKIVDLLFGHFALRKDPERAQEFVDQHWPVLKLLLPEPIAKLDEFVVTEWLRGHLQRVRLNQSRVEPTILLHKSRGFRDEEFYSLAEDFPYDDDPLPASIADERNLDFPLEKARDYMNTLLGAIGQGEIGKNIENPDDVAAQFQDFVWDLEKVGLRNWLRMDVSELERFLPKGDVSELSPDSDDSAVAKLMLRCAAREKSNLLEFDAVDPYKLLHRFPARAVDEELAQLPTHPHLSDDLLESLVDGHNARLERLRGETGYQRPATDKGWTKEGASVHDVFKKELDFYKTASPMEWNEDGEGGYAWKWKAPNNSFWDDKRKVYIREQHGVNPNLDLKEMRQFMLKITRMGSMCKDGRIYYFRVIVLVGNGKGVYGFGVGFGNTPKEARADAGLKALQNLDFIDMDPGRMLCTPVHGMEYKHACKIVPRPIGRGLMANKKNYPFLYILGLHNVKLAFPGAGTRWFTRQRAVKRTLDQIISRRTLANMTGKRHALLVAPGDHWVHWPDRWFDNIRKPYDAKDDYAKLMRRHHLCFKKRSNVVATHLEVKPGWRKESFQKWTNPLERWLQHRREFQPANLAPKRELDGAASESDNQLPPSSAGAIDSGQSPAASTPDARGQWDR